jgi:hypothetical protein
VEVHGGRDGGNLEEGIPRVNVAYFNIISEFLAVVILVPAL